jgi:hypothetical protein
MQNLNPNKKIKQNKRAKEHHSLYLNNEKNNTSSNLVVLLVVPQTSTLKPQHTKFETNTSK